METYMIEQEDKLGEQCKAAQLTIRKKFKRFQREIEWREMMFNYDMEMMIKHG
jgi:hypothetical protein